MVMGTVNPLPHRSVHSTIMQIPMMLVAMLAMSATVSGRFVVERNSLVVASPLFLRGRHDTAVANFGIPQYGGRMAGSIIYPKRNGNGCKDFDTSFRGKAGSFPTFLLLDREECLFTQKVWNAQKAGASAVLIVDDTMEPLITMDLPQDESGALSYMENITVPSALIDKKFGEKLKNAYNSGEMVNINLDWRESVPHPDDRVEYELWTNSNDECGPKCDMLMDFLMYFKGPAQILEKGGYTQFRPHYITWYCPQAFLMSAQCKSQCINQGRYCAPDPEQDFSIGYEGKDVVIENLRQICFFKVSNESSRPWVWWDYVTDFHIRCSMKDKKYGKECADSVIKSLGIDAQKISTCMGDPNADVKNPILEQEQDSQIGEGSRGDVTILPTLIVNNRQYRGKLDKVAVLKAICSGFEETTEPSVCLSSDIQTNECMVDNGGCWQDKASNITACKDTFRGRVCECPLVQGVKFMGDGYSHCQASGLGKCRINNGGCWNEHRNGQSFSACQEIGDNKCICPQGFRGDGASHCEDINECTEKTACQCPECSCTNTWGSYDCTCNGDDIFYIRGNDTCINKKLSEVKNTWTAVWVIFLCLSIASVGVYVVYKHRLRSYMDSEVRAIMAQYMPLENQGDVPNHAQQDLA